MQVTSVGHAGFRIDTDAGSILCDPWVNPAYFASWFPFPDNSTLDWDALGDCDYLYVSHLHKDHFDPAHLAAHVNKDAVVLLPDFPVPDLRRALEGLGFHRFFETEDSVKHRVSGPKGDLELMIIALRAPADGPIGDSGLVVSDGETVAFNMNDARPVELEALEANFGPVDVHMLQYSGAIWYPMVYDMPARAKESFGIQKRQRQMDRSRQYIAQVGATWVVPSAGPPCFLDDELRDLNDDHGDPANIFPDQVVFLEQMRRGGHDRGLLMIPGSAANFTGSQLDSLVHPVPEPEAIFTTDKAAYIEAYAQRMAPVLAAAKASWANASGESVLEPLRAKFEPIMLQSDQICDGIGYPVELRVGAETVVLDFPKRTVREAISDEKFRYGFEIAPELVRTVLRDDEPDWVNTIFLSTRFKAWRVGGYNEYLYTFFKCLTDERIAYADGWFAETHDDSASITLDGWDIQRRCPPPEGGPVEVRRGGRNDPDVQPAWLVVEPDQRPLPDVEGSRASEFEGVNPPDPRYDDGLIQLDRQAITLRRYHFPSGTSKVIPLRAVRGYRTESLGLVVNRFQIWGSFDLRRWLPLDVWRPIKSTLVTLDVPGTRPSPALTPLHAKEFLTVLDELLDR